MGIVVLPPDRELILPLRSTGTRRRLDLGWVLAVLAMVVLPVASWHEVTTVHEVCPEHGETLDVAAAPGCEPSSEGGPRWTTPDEAHGTHDVCPFLQLGQPSTTLSEPVLARALPLASRSEVSLAHRERHAPIPVLLLAPKQSPPV
jgi:hypothetical protein